MTAIFDYNIDIISLTELALVNDTAIKLNLNQEKNNYLCYKEKFHYSHTHT